MANKQRGKVKWFDDKKGYGFITRHGGKDLFVHYTGIIGEGHRSLTPGDTVQFYEDVSKENGKPIALEVEKI